MYGRACFAGVILFLSSLAAAAPLTDRQTIQLWNGQAPGALGDKPEDTPVVQVFLTHEASSASIVVCPGGGYGGLANHEGPKKHHAGSNRFRGRDVDGGRHVQRQLHQRLQVEHVVVQRVALAEI